MSAAVRGGGERLRGRRGGRTRRWLAAALALAAAAPARGASLVVQEGPVVLGKTESCTVVIQTDDPAAGDETPLRLSVNVGSFSEPVRLGPGRYRAVYSPPATRFPQVALVAAWRETGPDARVDFLRLPLLGVARLPVTARPGARVRVRVGSETFGPAVADRSGRAVVPVVVPPGVTQGQILLKEKRGAEVVRSIPVEAPPYNRLTAAIVPHAAAADGATAVRLEVLYDLGGAEVPPDRIQVTPSVGAVSLRSASRGLFSFRYTPPAGAPAPSVTFAISVAGDPTARATALLSLRAPPPARVVVTAPPPARAGSGAPAVIDVLVVDAGGNGLPGLEVDVTANGEPLPLAAARRDGHYEYRLTAPAALPPGGLVALEAVAHHRESFAFGSATWRVEPPAAPPAAPPRPPAPRVPDAREPAEPRLALAPGGGSPGWLRARADGVEPRACVPPAGLGDGVPTAPGPARPGIDRSGPRRHGAGRLLAGLTGGYTRAPGVASGLRGGAELWVPFRVGEGRLGVGATITAGTASRTVTDATGTLRSATEASFVPVALKLGYEAYAGGRLSLTVGAGPMAAWARFRASLASGSEQGVGLGWLGFVDLGWAAGPGVAALGLAYGSARVATTDYRIDPGGLSVTAGYRVRLF